MLRDRTWGANTHTLLNLYKSYIRPVIEYGSVLTADVSKSNMNKLQILQNKALRVITQRPYDTPIKELHELCNIQMIKDRLIQLKSNSLQRFGNSELMQELVSRNPHFNFPDISSQLKRYVKQWIPAGLNNYGGPYENNLSARKCHRPESEYTKFQKPNNLHTPANETCQVVDSRCSKKLWWTLWKHSLSMEVSRSETIENKNYYK